jgi:Protein of unknown function (DUF3489)
MKLTDSHLVLLSAAAQHADGLLARPDAMPDKAAQALARKLVRAGLAEAITLTPDQPSWREDDEHRPMGLRITAAGLATLGLEAEEPSAPVGMVAHQPLPGQSPRAGTKQAHIIALLEREEGVSLDDLIAATGWLPHTTRAALTRLRQSGFTLAKSTGEDGRTRYRIHRPQPQPRSAPDVEAEQGA